MSNSCNIIGNNMAINSDDFEEPNRDKPSSKFVPTKSLEDLEGKKYRAMYFDDGNGVTQASKDKTRAVNEYEKTPIKIWFFRIISFISGFCLCVLLEVLFFHSLLGLNIKVISSIGGFSAVFFGLLTVQLAPLILADLKTCKEKLIRYYWSMSRLNRGLILAPLLWFILVILFVFFFRPYGAMSDEDYVRVFKIIIFPPLVVLICYYAYKKLILEDSDKSDGHN